MKNSNYICRRQFFSAPVLAAVLIFIVSKGWGQQNWLPVGPNDFDQLSYSYANYVRATKGAGDVLYVVFQDQSSGNKALAKKYDGSKWVSLGTGEISSGIAESPDIALGKDGAPYVVYQDAAAGYGATVKKYGGSGWATVGQEGFSGGVAIGTRIAVAPDGTPYVVYRSVAEGGKAVVKKFNGNAWITVGVAGISVGGAYWPGIAIGSNGTPYIVYADYGYGLKAVVKKFSDTAWTNVGNPFFSVAGAEYTEIALTSGNTPFVIYRDQATGYKATVKRLAGASWVTVGQEGFSIASCEYPSIAISPDSAVYVAYRDNGTGGKASVKRFDGTAWQAVGEESIFDANAKYTSLVATGNNSLCLAFSNLNIGGKLSVAVYKSGTWKTPNVVAPITKIFVKNQKITVGSNNTPYLIFPGGGLTQISPVAVMKFVWPVWELLPELPDASAGSPEQVFIKTNDEGVFVALNLFSPDTSRCKVYYRNNSGWLPVGNTDFTGPYAGSIDFVLDKTGIPYLAYNDYAIGYNVAVRRYNGSVWEPVGSVVAPGVNVISFKLAFAADNSPVLAYGYLGNYDTIVVKKFNGNTWEPIGDNKIVAQLDEFDLAIAADGAPHLLYRDPDYKVRLVRFDGQQWNTLGLFLSTKYALALSGNTPYVAYQDAPANYKGFVERWNGQDWVILGGGPVSAAEMWEKPSLSITDDRVVYIAYDSHGLFVKSYDDACVAVPAISGPDTVTVNQPVVFHAGAGFLTYSWDAGSGAILGGQGTAQVQLSFPVAGQTTIRLTVTDSSGCTPTVTREFYVRESVGTSIATQPVTVRTMRNPFDDLLMFEVTPSAGTTRYLRVSDLAGRSWWESTDAFQGVFRIETRSWPPGIYYLQVKTGGLPATLSRLVKI